ncbi:MAG: phage portal protein [Nitrospira sp.]|nr:phage portal protein [Nitrospira sp.]
MRILQRLKKTAQYFRNLGVDDPKAWDPLLWNLCGAQSLSGETVTEQSALTYSAVWNAVTLIAGTIASLPLHLMQMKAEKKRIASDRVMYRVLHDQANPFMAAKTLRETLMGHILLWGNGYAEKVVNGYGELVQLWPIAPNLVTPMWRDGDILYRVKVGKEDKYFTRDKILHIPGIGFDGLMGYSVVAMARKSIGLGMAMETFGSLYFGNGTHPGVIVSHPNQLSAAAHANLKKSLTEGYSGLGQSHRLLLLEEGMKLEKVGVPPEDAQFLESRQFQIPEIARWFNLPPHKLKDLTRSSFNNIESEQRSFYTDTLLPWLVTLEQNYNMQLLTDSDRALSGRGRLYYKHVVEGILRADAAGRGAFYREMFNIGAFSINEIRQLEDKDPIEGGDIHLVPMNMTSLQNAGKLDQSLEPQRPMPGDDKGGEDQ